MSSVDSTVQRRRDGVCCGDGRIISEISKESVTLNGLLKNQKKTVIFSCDKRAFQVEEQYEEMSES